MKHMFSVSLKEVWYNNIILNETHAVAADLISCPLF